MTESLKQIIITSLWLRKNIIETGDPYLSANDAQNQGLKVNALHEDQMKLMLKINKLIRILEK